MGMSASQLRYVMLTGRKSDVEFQGQQINQQRTTLATETSAYNTQLLNLVVPTPPSSDQYVTTSYTFSSNGQTRTVTGSTYDSNSGTYTVNYTTQQTTSQGESTGSSVFTNVGTPAAPQYQINGNTVSAVDNDAVGSAAAATDAANIAMIEKDCGIPKYKTTLTDGTGTPILDANGKQTQTDLSPIATNSTANNYNAQDITNLQAIFKGTNGTAVYDPSATYYKYTTGTGATTATRYVAASDINSSGAAKSYLSTEVAGTAGQGLPANLAETKFYTYTEGGSPKYVLATDLKNNAGTTTAISTYEVNPNATVTTSSKMTGAQVTWSNSGRMSSITDSAGHNYSLSVTSANDNTAYEDAYNEYEYKKNQYDQEMDNINSKIDIVESQDKKLELKLQNLDTQQQALSTEMDSVKKVVDKNIESSFKAFA